MIRLTRVYRFSASHRLHSPLLSEEENAATFGKCNNPYGHGHDYVLSITVAGPVDPQTGRLVCVGELDRLVHSQVLDVFAHRNLNVDVPQFADMVPTTENVALVIADLLEQHWRQFIGANRARLYRVHVQETERNGFEVLLPARQPKKLIQSEGLLAHA